MPLHQRFFQQTAALSKLSFFSLKGEFGRWALHQLLEAQATIAEEIDPRVWREALGLTRREEEEE